jgi:hypothetical protein
MDIPQVLAVLRPDDDWGPNAQSTNTYAELAAAWRGASGVPTLEQMQAEWAAIEAGRPAALLAAARARAKELLDLSEDGREKLARAIVLVSMDEVNALRAWVTAFKGAVAASSSLADLKSRVAALDNLPQRTAALAKTAVRNRIDTDEAD